jgi:RNA polymerase sigma-54 factor
MRFAEVPDLTDTCSGNCGCRALPDLDMAIAIAIVESLDDDGYLHEDDAIIDAVDDEHPPAEEVAAVRHFVQRLEPVGVASRDLATA